VPREDGHAWDSNLHVGMPAEQRAALERRAHHRGLRVGTYVRYLLQADLQGRLIVVPPDVGIEIILTVKSRERGRAT
jgi:hypothetical protein